MWSIDLLRASGKLLEQASNTNIKSGEIAPAKLVYVKAGNQILVARYCHAAKASGVRFGMALSMAKILATHQDSEPLCFPLDAKHDFHALCQLALWGMKISPLVALDEELLLAFKTDALSLLSPLHSGLIFDITGTERIHHGYDTLLARLSRAFAKKNIEARFAIAPTIGAAWALSRFGRNTPAILDKSVKIEDALSLLPLQALRLQRETVLSLKQLGINTVAQVLKLPSHSLTQRFGPLLLKRINQAIGLQEEALHFAKAKEVFEAEKIFDIPLLNHNSLKTVIIDLFKMVLGKLGQRSKRASSFTIEIHKLDRERNLSVCTREVALYHASTKESHITSVIQPVVESVVAEEGVCLVRVAAHLISAQNAEQKLLIETVREHSEEVFKKAGGELLNHLVVRLGKDKVMQVSFEASWIPEKSFSYHSVQREKQKALQDFIATDRPPYFLSTPQPAQVVALMPDSPPARIIWQGQRLKIIHGKGPERINAEWWHSQLNSEISLDARDYFKIQDETGRWLWVFRDQRTSEWFVQGMWV